MRLRMFVVRCVPLFLLLLMLVQGCSAEGFECRTDGDCKVAGHVCEKGWCKAKTTPLPCQKGLFECVSASKSRTCEEGGEWKEAACQNDELCDVAAKSCKKKVACSKDVECKGATHPFCSSDGKCEWACKQDTDCKSGGHCKAHLCRPLGWCADASDCTDAGKPRCSASSTCVQCLGDVDCKSTERCEADACVPKTGCLLDSDCQRPGFTKCKVADKKCVRCLVDGDCGSTERCVSDACVPQAGCVKDADCQDPKVPKCEGASKKCVQCLGDGDCLSGHECKGNVCVPVVGCAVDGDCKDPSRGRCEPTSKRCVRCLKAADCAASEDCVSHQCLPKAECFSSADCTNPFKSKCDTSLKLCVECLVSADCLDGSKPLCRLRTCTADPGKTRKLGETCKLPFPRDPGYNDCLPSLGCYKRFCREICNPSKPGDCASSQLCVKDAQTAFSVCLEKCDPKNGILSKDCRVGTYCLESSTAGVGFCELLSPRTLGTRTQGQECATFSSHASEYCDGTKGLFCYGSTCLKACDTRQGTATNPLCGANEECAISNYSLFYSYLGGVCLPKKVQKLGDYCESPDRRCLDGLVCKKNRCYQVCGVGGKACGANQLCEKDSSGEVCYDKCDASKGKFVAGCKADHFCLKSSASSSGVCYPMPWKQQGTKKLGESCTNFRASGYCDGSQGIFCFNDVGSMTCEKACDPRKGNADCGTGICVEDPYQSFLGGLCRAQPTQKIGEYCESNKRCIAGLKCEDHRCYQKCTSVGDCPSGQLCDGSVCFDKCDPSRGKFSSDCKPETYCVAGSGGLAPGYCKALPIKRQGPRKLGESCYDTDSSKQCDGSSGLFCYFEDFNYTCRKACDLRKGNADCGAQGECIEELYRSHLGGMCVPKGTRSIGQSCDRLNNRCNAGLTCFNNTCFTKCTSTKDCAGGQACMPSEAVCVDLCDPTKGKFSKECPVGFYCRADSFVFKPGFCMWLAPRKTGTKKLGESCSNIFPELRCDANTGLFCFDDGAKKSCQKACDPRKGNADCSTNEKCTEQLTDSFLGGLCK